MFSLDALRVLYSRKETFRVAENRCLQLVADSIKYRLRTADCGLGIKYGLGIKRGLEIRTGYKTRTRYKTRTADCGLGIK